RPRGAADDRVRLGFAGEFGAHGGALRRRRARRTPATRTPPSGCSLASRDRAPPGLGEAPPDPLPRTPVGGARATAPPPDGAVARRRRAPPSATGRRTGATRRSSRGAGAASRSP